MSFCARRAWSPSTSRDLTGREGPEFGLLEYLLGIRVASVLKVLSHAAQDRGDDTACSVCEAA